MAVVHRALFTWFSALWFLIFLVLRLDRKTSSWFVVFTPMFFFDLILLLYVSFRFAAQCRSRGGVVITGFRSTAATTTTVTSLSSTSGHRARHRAASLALGSYDVTVHDRTTSISTVGCAPWLKPVSRNSCLLVCVILKLTFQVALCVKLEYPDANVPLRYVFAPLWLLLGGLCVIVFRDLVHMCRY